MNSTPVVTGMYVIAVRKRSVQPFQRSVKLAANTPLLKVDNRERKYSAVRLLLHTQLGRLPAIQQQLPVFIRLLRRQASEESLEVGGWRLECMFADRLRMSINKSNQWTSAGAYTA